MVIRHLPRLTNGRGRQRLDRIPLDGTNPAVYPAAALRGSPPHRIGVASEGAAGLSIGCRKHDDDRGPEGRCSAQHRWARRRTGVGGPMLTGHASHQVGLDADIWLTPMPNRELTREEREEMSATMIVAEDRLDVDPQVWTPAHLAVIRAAAKDPQVARIFVNAAIKKALCRDAGTDRGWLGKVQPWWGHDFHFHVRLVCPSDNAESTPQPPPPAPAASAQQLSYWFTDAVLHPRPSPAAKPKPGPKMADLPAACRQVLLAP